MTTVECIKQVVNEAPYDENKEDDQPINALPTIHRSAFFGILNDFVEASQKNSEASPVAVAANVLAWFSCMIDREVHQWIGDSQIHCRPFFLLVGKSGKARKGTSEALPRRVFNRVDDFLKERNSQHKSLNVHGGGLSSGEGIAFAIRDPSEEDEKDLGVNDKRLLVVETEFANVLANCKRETSTLSAVIRNVFDGRDLNPLTKKNRIKASNPHVVIVGHITAQELTDKIFKGIEATNGLMNRFLMLFVAREQFVPLPTATPDHIINELAEKIISILNYVRNLESKEITMNQEAKKYWEKIYITLSQDNPGLIGSLLARTEVYTRMLAMIFALLDQKNVIELSHLKASARWISYTDQSIRYLFGSLEDQFKENEKTKFAEEVFQVLLQRQMNRTDLNKHFNGHKASSEIKNALEWLLNQSPARIVQIKQKTGGRSKIIFTAKKAEKEEKAK